MEEKYLHEVTNKNINDYPKKEIILADLFHLSNGKTRYCIIDNCDKNMKVLYTGIQEYLETNYEGCTSSLCDKTVDAIDTTVDGSIMVFLNIREANK